MPYVEIVGQWRQLYSLETSSGHRRYYEDIIEFRAYTLGVWQQGSGRMKI